MTDKPILFSAPMVRALLEGRKTQTRRTEGIIIERTTDAGRPLYHVHTKHGGLFGVEEADIGREAASMSRFQPGDWLWVKETWSTGHAWDGDPPSRITPGSWVAYHADMPQASGKTRVSIHMPKWASRLSLQVTEVRVQRLQDISEEDAKAEGVQLIKGRWEVPGIVATPVSAPDAYGALMDYLHGAGFWASNPWVTAITFKVHHKNINQITAEDANA